LLDGKAIQADDVVVGVASSGLHSNGYSLVRKVVFDQANLSVDERIDELEQTVADILLEPTRLYARPLRAILSHYTVKHVVHGVAHITGGGLQENLQRILPEGVGAKIERHVWPVPPVFRWIQKLGDIDSGEMDRVFNMGLGLVLVVSPYYAESIRHQLRDFGLESWVIGRITSGTTEVQWT
jgi:phosphoribosylformylglycinamidine cyclo-ligase